MGPSHAVASSPLLADTTAAATLLILPPTRSPPSYRRSLRAALHCFLRLPLAVTLLGVDHFDLRASMTCQALPCVSSMSVLELPRLIEPLCFICVARSCNLPLSTLCTEPLGISPLTDSSSSQQFLASVRCRGSEPDAPFTSES
jgi:hypothetical protein